MPRSSSHSNAPVETVQTAVLHQAPAELTGALNSRADTPETIGTQYRKLSRMEIIRGQSLEEVPEILSANSLKAAAKTLPALAGVIDSSLAFYQKQGLDDLPLRKALTHLVHAGPSERVLGSLQVAIEKFEENGWRLSKLIDSTSALTVQSIKDHLLTPELLANFGIAYAWMDMTICNFDREERPGIMPIVATCIENGLSADGIFACCSMLAGTEGTGRSEINRCCNFIQLVLPEELRTEVVKALRIAPVDAPKLLECLNQVNSHWRACPPEAQPLFQKLAGSAINLGHLDLKNTLQYFVERVARNMSFTDLQLFVRFYHYFAKPAGETKHSEITPGGMLASIQSLTEKHKRDFLRQDAAGAFPDSSSAMQYLAWLTVKSANATARLLPNTRRDNPDVQIFLKGIEILQAHGFAGLTVIGDTISSLKALRKQHGKEVFNQILSDTRELQKKGFACLDLLELYSDFHSRHKSETERKLYLKLFEVVESEAPRSCERVDNIFSESYTFPAQLAENLLAELSRPDSRYSGTQIMRATRDAAIQGLVSEYLRTPKDDTKKLTEVTDEMEHIVGMYLNFDDLTPELSARTSRVMAIQSRIKALNTGFIGLAADAESRHSDDNLSMIERMGRCLGTSLCVHAVSSGGVPVKAGMILNNVDLKRVFAPDLDKLGDPFHRYKEAWPEYAGILDNVSRVSFIPIRNGFWISAPKDMGFNLLYPGETQPTNYSLVVFNDHYGSVSESAFLVKTSILQRRLSPCLFDSELGSNAEEAADFNQAGLDPHSLRALNDSDPLAVIDIGSGSTVLGGFATAFDPRAPHFSVFHHRSPEERYATTNYGYPEYNGTSRDDHQFYVTSETARDFSMLHNQVADISERGLLYMELYLIMLSQFKKGYVDERPTNTFDVILGEENEENDEASEFQTSLETVSVPTYLDSSVDREATRGNLRLLEEARRYHEMAMAKGSPSKDFRVLGLCDTVNLASRPDQAIFLDTETGVLSVYGSEYQLNLDSLEITEEDRQIWKEQVLPRLDSYFLTLRFFRKENLLKDETV